MRNFKIIITLFLIIITMYIAASKPTVHKQFVIAPTTFKLTSANQIPEVSQSTALFKLFEAKQDTIISQNETSKDSNISVQNEQTSQEVTIIPSSFISSSSSQNSWDNNSYIENERQKIELSNRLNTETMQRYNEQRRTKNNQINNNIYNQTNNNTNNQINQINNTKDDNIIRILDKLNEEVGSCPICESLKAGRTEDIAWNIWRSRLQNTIMDISDVADTPAGTLYTFSFDVDDKGNIAKLKINSNYPRANYKVEQAIKSLERTPILNFPVGTKRKTIHFKGSFLMSYYTRHSTPDDYKDIERITK